MIDAFHEGSCCVRYKRQSSLISVYARQDCVEVRSARVPIVRLIGCWTF